MSRIELPPIVLTLALLSAACAPPPSAPPPSGPPRERAPASPPPASSAPATANALPAPPPATVPEVTPAASPAQLSWALEVEPKSMAMAQRASCRVRISVTNRGQEPAAPALHMGTWTLDGRPAMGLGMSFQNGASTRNDALRWESLAPNDSVSTERAPCATLFPKPGHYVIGFDHGASHVTAEVDVTP